MMRNALILHSIPQAEHFVRTGVKENYDLFSSHSSVCMHLKEFYGIKCECLSTFLDIDEIVGLRQLSYATVDRLLSILDKEITPQINFAYNLSINYFHTLYDYPGRYQLASYIYFATAIERIIAFGKYNSLYFYDYPLDCFFDTTTTVENLFSEFPLAARSEKIPYDFHRDRKSMRGFSRLGYQLKRPLRISRFLTERFFRKRTVRELKEVDPAKGVLLINGLLAELAFLLDEPFMKKYNIIHIRGPHLTFRRSKLPPIPDMALPPPVLKDDFGALSPYVGILLKDICEDFSINSSEYIGSIKDVKEIHKNHPVSLAVWGIDPTSGREALCNEYLRSASVAIVGAQHGGLYAETANMQYETALERCNYFIGYGYSVEDMKRLFPDREFKATILPFGKVVFPRRRKKQKAIDILFPITNTVSMFEGGMHRCPPDRLTDRQMLLLKYLNTLDTATVYVKPFVNVDRSNLSVLGPMKKMRNLRVSSDLTLNEFLEIYSPRAVIIELPSQPLYEVLHLDAEIFLLGDPVLPWEEQALRELKKRVHYAEDAGQIVDMIDLFLNNRLEPKRDRTYFNHYVSKQHTKENIVNFIDGLMANHQERLKGEFPVAD